MSKYLGEAIKIVKERDPLKENVVQFPQDAKWWGVIESPNYKATIKKLSDEEIVELYKFINRKLDQLFAAGYEKAYWDTGAHSSDGLDYSVMGALSGGRKSFEAALKGEVADEDEGALTYPLYDEFERRNMDQDELDKPTGE